VTKAEEYFNERLEDPEYRAAYNEARWELHHEYGSLEDINDRIVRMSRCVDAALDADGVPKNVQSWVRVAKIVEELGEAFADLVSHSGGQPRKPRKSMDDVRKELLDVAGSALMAWVHTHDNVADHDVMAALNEGLHFVTDRVGA
jgi:NTP pyrophosphatase (non-canonical NTP hydrolase)